mmetsp:Transcript_64285/g.199023  ORF Transcript_64285/g.199023 Transcript_64285/m.199023 type:complete len:208 (+) Transcript_64285:735-1358(+)
MPRGSKTRSRRHVSRLFPMITSMTRPSTSKEKLYWYLYPGWKVKGTFAISSTSALVLLILPATTAFCKTWSRAVSASKSSILSPMSPPYPMPDVWDRRCFRSMGRFGFSIFSVPAFRTSTLANDGMYLSSLSSKLALPSSTNVMSATATYDFVAQTIRQRVSKPKLVPASMSAWPQAPACTILPRRSATLAQPEMPPHFTTVRIASS